MIASIGRLAAAGIGAVRRFCCAATGPRVQPDVRLLYFIRRSFFEGACAQLVASGSAPQFDKGCGVDE